MPSYSGPDLNDYARIADIPASAFVTQSILTTSQNFTGVGLSSVVALALNANRRFVSYDNGSAIVWRSLT